MGQTKRLSLDRYRSNDIEAVFSILGDAEAMRFTHFMADLAACRHHLETHEAQRAVLGYAPWVVRERQSRTVIGWGGLYDDPFDPGWGPEVAYFFSRAAWGHGFATELVGHSRDLGMTECGLDLIRAFAHPLNLASQRVLEKTGFARVDFVPEMDRWLYEARRC
jgi:[ribosomal protein S5]-alanine N-acetyltransferase